VYLFVNDFTERGEGEKERRKEGKKTKPLWNLVPNNVDSLQSSTT
jgi:hypothetical protein